MSITPGKWRAECVGVGGSYDNPTDVYEVSTSHARIAEFLTEADAKAIAEVPAMLDEIRRYVCPACNLKAGDPDPHEDMPCGACANRRAILKRIEG